MTAEVTWPQPDWTRGSFQHDGHDHAYYVLDRHAPTGPSLLLMHEFPGISDSLIDLANDLAQDFRIVVPSIVGRDGSPRVTRSLVDLCVRREVNLLRLGRESKAVPWLLRLLQEVVSGGRPCGVIGMCMTGGFALALAVDPRVRAAVMAQPAVPPSHLGKLPLPRAKERGADLGLTVEDRERLTRRIQADPECLRVRGYRYDGDDQSPIGKMTAAQELLGAPVMTFVPLTPGTPGQHSTLTGDHKDPAAVADVRSFLLERLGSS